VLRYVVNQTGRRYLTRVERSRDSDCSPTADATADGSQRDDACSARVRAQAVAVRACVCRVRVQCSGRCAQRAGACRECRGVAVVRLVA